MPTEKLQAMIDELEEYYYGLLPNQIELKRACRGTITELVHLISELMK